jgi:hypothetical protein
MYIKIKKTVLVVVLLMIPIVGITIAAQRNKMFYGFFVESGGSGGGRYYIGWR